ncbi:hypothetical protein [Longispora fulva]|uniref:Uncharacterized protein n=1 Tax=Longispora fulva TaxID=619741 RepID=A0A8J7GY24_9ACTN|nr:hypothetical protein [Longispora fulva]MBG6140221.1 hypothetical protein [Longispora fulva]
MPALSYEIAWNSDPNNPASVPIWTPVTNRVAERWGTNRGIQYEQNQAKVGELRLPLRNDDGALDPSNTLSPYAPGVVPYRRVRVRATWPPTGGTTYSIFNGFVERYSQHWHGGFGLCDTVSVDAFAQMAKAVMPGPLVSEVLALKPSYLYRLSDAGEAFADTIGAGPLIQRVDSGAGPGTLTSATTIGAAGAPPVGLAGPVVQLTNPINTADTGGVSPSTPGTALLVSGANSEQTVTSTPLTPRSFTRIIAFRWIGPPSTSIIVLWRAGGGGVGNQAISLTLDPNIAPTPVLRISVRNTADFQSGTWARQTIAGPVFDGNWHLAMVSVDAAGTLTLGLDDVTAIAPTLTSAAWDAPWDNDFFGGVAFPESAPGDGFQALFNGQMALAAQFPAPLTLGQWATLTTAFKTAFTGESSGARYGRILRYAGWTGPTALDTGQSTSMGPASDITGQTALAALNNVVLSENGQHFVKADGTIRFESRTARYLASTPQFIFGENVAAGEFPYESDVTLELDPTRIANDITVTRTNGIAARRTDQASQYAYGASTLNRTISVTSDLETVDAAGYLLAQRKQPRQRLDRVTFKPSNNPALWPMVLALDISTRVRVMRRPFNAPPIKTEAFVSSIDWEHDPATGEVTVTVLVDPADPSGIWILDDSTQSVLGQTTALAY